LKNEKITYTSCFQASATELPYPDNYFDAVFTDPPYYDNVHYAELSDFFYVWLKRSIGDLYPELFSTPLTPKSEEIVAKS
jgi:putative DNA methylase